MIGFPRRGSRRQDRFLRSLEDASFVAVVTHDNPDPDAIAASWGVVALVEKVLGRSARIYAGGAITRAENRTMVDLLDPPLDMIDDWLLPEAGTAIVVVDTVFPARLAAWPVHIPIAAVIDHHQHEPSPHRSASEARLRFRFRDIRPQVVASSSMVTGYLRGLDQEPDKVLATALLYGIHTDAHGWDVKFTRTDRAAIAWLGQFSDPELRARIERPPLPRNYYGDLLLGLESSFIYQDTAVAFLPNATGSELVGEVADLLLRCEGVTRVLCGAVIGKRLVLSARSSSTPKSAAQLLIETLNGEGSCGGHRNRAGGYLKLPATDCGLQELTSRLRSSWLQACGIRQQRGQRLVPKREILKALD